MLYKLGNRRAGGRGASTRPPTAKNGAGLSKKKAPGLNERFSSDSEGDSAGQFAEDLQPFPTDFNETAFFGATVHDPHANKKGKTNLNEGSSLINSEDQVVAASPEHKKAKGESVMLDQAFVPTGIPIINSEVPEKKAKCPDGPVVHLHNMVRSKFNTVTYADPACQVDQHC